MINTVAKWETVYRLYLEQLEYLVLHYMKGDIARRLYMQFSPPAVRLTVLEQLQNDASNVQFSGDEESSFALENGAVAVLPDNLSITFGVSHFYKTKETS